MTSSNERKYSTSHDAGLEIARLNSPKDVNHNIVPLPVAADVDKNRPFWVQRARQPISHIIEQVVTKPTTRVEAPIVHQTQPVEQVSAVISKEADTDDNQATEESPGIVSPGEELSVLIESSNIKENELSPVKDENEYRSINDQLFPVLKSADMGSLGNMQMPLDSESEALLLPESVHEREKLRVTVATVEQGKQIGRNPEMFRSESEDCILVDQTRHIYGVFDGMGGAGGNPSAAAQAARDAVNEILTNAAEPDTIEELKGLMKLSFAVARQRVISDGEGGSTVGTAIKIATIDGKRYMGVAHAGDTRLLTYDKKTGLSPGADLKGEDSSKIYKDTYGEFCFNKLQADGAEAFAATTDQSRGNKVSNYIGSSQVPDEYHVIEVTPDTRLLLCSDGITGDWQRQFLSSSEVRAALMLSATRECADRFLKMSTKNDDKSIIVIEIEN